MRSQFVQSSSLSSYPPGVISTASQRECMPIDPAELETLIDRYWFVLVQWVGGNRMGADDVVQSAFIQLAAEEPPPRDSVAWLFTVTKRLAINEHISRTKRRNRESHVGNQPLYRNDISAKTEIEELLESLDAREREIVTAKVWGGLTFEEIGSLLGESKATVWRDYQSGLQKLKDSYSRYCSE